MVARCWLLGSYMGFIFLFSKRLRKLDWTNASEHMSHAEHIRVTSPSAAAPGSFFPPPPWNATSSRDGRRATMAARKLMVLAATLLECHSASALAIPFFGARLPPPAPVTRSIGTQLASVDPAVWAAGAGVAATIRKTIRLQREAVAQLTIDEYMSTSNKSERVSPFDRNRKALAEAVEKLRNNEGVALSVGVLCRCAFQLFILPLVAVRPWPEAVRVVAVAIASLYVSNVCHVRDSDVTL